MRAQPLGAVLTFSIDLPRGGETAVSEHIRALLAAADIRATWFSDEPVRDATSGRMLADDRGDEIGLRISVAPGCETCDGESLRIAIAEVSRCKAQAEQVGIGIATLAVSDVASLPAERLVKLGIRAVRPSIRAESTSPDDAGFSAMRFGLWRATPGFVFRGGAGFGAWRKQMQIRSAINRCASRSEPLHLAIDVAAIAASGNADRLGGLQNIVRQIERRRAAGQLEVRTISEAVARLASPPSQRSAASILRAA